MLDINDMKGYGDLPADETWVLVLVRDPGGDWQPTRQYIQLERIPRHFGGTQAYFRCWCDRRASKLYQLRRGYGFFRCRRCLRLAYTCQREDAVDRAFRAVGKIKARLGGDPDWTAPFPPKPRDMWRRTYERAWYRFLEAEERAEKAFEQQAGALVARLRL